MKRIFVLFLLCVVWGTVVAASTNAVPAAVASTNEVSVAVRNPFWPIGYTGEITRISAEVRPKPKPKPQQPKIEPKKNIAVAKETAAKEAKEAAEKAAISEKTAKEAAAKAKAAAEKAAAEAAKPREITSDDWRKAQKALKFGSPALFKAEDGTTRSSININGNIYVDGDLMSFTHDGARFTWRIQGLDGKDKKLKLKRVQARIIEQPKKEEPKKAGGGK